MKARIAVVGCGWWATEAHMPALARNPRAELAALVDPSPARLAAAAERFSPAATFGGVEDLLAAGNVDGVIVAVPHGEHRRVAQAVLEAGLHVLVEKPLTIAADDARALVELARRAEVELIVGYPWHYNAHARAAREAIAAGRIGEIEHVACLFASIARQLYAGRPDDYQDVLGYTTQTPEPTTYSDPAAGGQGQTQLTHSAALLLWLSGLVPTGVTGFVTNRELPVDLADAVAVRFANGAVGTLASTGSVTPGHEELLEYRVFGTRGHLVLDIQGGSMAIHDASGVEHAPPLDEALRYPHWAPSANLVDVVLDGAVNQSPGTLGARVVELIDGMYRSARSGQSQRLAPPDPPSHTH
jgi:predicted dehydrogenase